ncbi:MAG: inositol monophosphatase family protein [Maioricimonas sp. JB049]
MQELEIARRAAQIGGDVVARAFRDGVTIHSKATANLVSDADLESERVIAECITAAFPEHVILGEELHSGEVTAEHLWIVDPIDGTNNFAHGIPHFAVSMAYYRSGQPVCGVVFNPARDDWFVAVRGAGATYNGRRAAVTQAASLSEVLIGLGFYYDRGAMMEATLAAARDLFGQQIHGIRRFGTAALDLCQVGTGMFGGFFEYQLSPWDFAAGRLFVEEAGGRITTARGDALPLETTSVLASNGPLHEPLLSIVAAHHP